CCIFCVEKALLLIRSNFFNTYSNSSVLSAVCLRNEGICRRNSNEGDPIGSNSLADYRVIYYRVDCNLHVQEKMLEEMSLIIINVACIIPPSLTASRCATKSKDNYAMG